MGSWDLFGAMGEGVCFAYHRHLSSCILYYLPWNSMADNIPLEAGGKYNLSVEERKATGGKVAGEVQN